MTLSARSGPIGNLGFQEILVIAFIALLVFGPDRLPEFARQAGKLLARFRQETSKSVAELKKAADIGDLDREIKAVRSELRELGRDLSGLGDGSPRSGNGDEPLGSAPPPRSEPPPLDLEAT